MDINAQLAAEFHLQLWQVENTVNLIDEGNTIPFIARYRKEAHGTLDDQVLREINDRLEYLRGLEKRKEEVISSIENLGMMTDEITTDRQYQASGNGPDGNASPQGYAKYKRCKSQSSRDRE